MSLHVPSSARLVADNPIRRREDDVLGRTKAARSFADQILSLDATEGIVVGVLGPWGSGKTSFVNLARERLEEAGIPVLEFNPWMFSGAEQLVGSFFIELSAQLKLRAGLADVGREFEDYGESFSGMSWLPVVGPWIERSRMVTSFLGKLLQRRKEGLGGRRAKLEKALTALAKPLVAVVDDIDRLTTSEIRDIFKLVRLTASFPNVIYVVAFDRRRVEDALAEQGIPGRDYLEKILQVAIDLPAVPANVLDKQIFTAIDNVLSRIEEKGPFDRDRWPDIFVEVIRPLVRSMRDVRRYAAAIHGTVRDLAGQVALVDVLALEAIRVFLPDVFRQVHASVEGLTTPSGVGRAGHRDPPHLKEQIDRLIGTAGDRAEVVRAMIHRLFLGAQRHVGGSHFGGEWGKQWLRDRRVAHEDVLRAYLERAIGEGLQAFTDAERAFARLGDLAALDEYLRSLDPERLQDVISSLEVFEEHFAPEHVVPGAVVLLNLLHTFPNRSRGMFELEPRMVVSRVVYRLVRSLKERNAIEVAVRRILPQVRSLSSKFELITDVGYREGAGNKLVSESTAQELERDWRSEVRLGTAELLAGDRDLLRVLLFAKREAAASEPPIVVPDTPEVTLALLRSARSDVKSRPMDSRALQRSPRLAWDLLVELAGGEDLLRDRIAKLVETKQSEGDEAVQLAVRYLGGCRPSEHRGE